MKGAHSAGILGLIFSLAALSCSGSDPQSTIRRAVDAGDAKALPGLIEAWFTDTATPSLAKLEFLADAAVGTDFPVHSVLHEQLRQRVRALDVSELPPPDSLSSQALLRRGMLLQCRDLLDEAKSAYRRAAQLDSTSSLAQRSLAACEAHGRADAHGRFDAHYSGTMRFLRDGAWGSLPTVPADSTFKIEGKYGTRVGEHVFAGEITDWVHIFADSARSELVGWGVCVTSGTVLATAKDMRDFASPEREQFAQSYSSSPFDALGNYYTITMNPAERQRLVIPVVWLESE